MLRVADGNDLAAIAAGARRRRATRPGGPTLVILRTRIGDPAPTKRDTAAAHGAPLGEEEVAKTKAILGWPETPFHVAPEAAAWREQLPRRGARSRRPAGRSCSARYRAAHPADAAELDAVALAATLPGGWDAGLPAFTPADGQLATRQASAKVLNALAARLPNLDRRLRRPGREHRHRHQGRRQLRPRPRPAGTFHWGVREHAMAACLNGMAAHGGVRPFGSTFLIFTDYCKPSIRLAGADAAAGDLHRHPRLDRPGRGRPDPPADRAAGDAPRHSRTSRCIRPADATETVEAWKAAIERTDGPTVLALSRQKLPVLDRDQAGARRRRLRAAATCCSMRPAARRRPS